jgi:hypothetical protein
MMLAEENQMYFQKKSATLTNRTSTLGRDKIK